MPFQIDFVALLPVTIILHQPFETLSILDSTPRGPAALYAAGSLNPLETAFWWTPLLQRYLISKYGLCLAQNAMDIHYR